MISPNSSSSVASNAAIISPPEVFSFTSMFLSFSTGLLSFRFFTVTVNKPVSSFVPSEAITLNVIIGSSNVS